MSQRQPGFTLIWIQLNSFHTDLSALPEAPNASAGDVRDEKGRESPAAENNKNATSEKTSYDK